jgi:DNA (cytosine-5)-methyltransferase 1
MDFSFVDLFSGLGGFHLALKKLGGKCVYAAEKNPKLNNLYSLNFPDLELENLASDITKVDYSKIPNHDVLCAGFPCQPFSKAGKRKGMKDPLNGFLFNSILQTIDAAKSKPKFIILENVPNILTLNKGVYWNKIRKTLTSRGYEIDWKVLSPTEFGIPQIRKRVFIVGALNGLNHFEWPKNINGYKILDDYLEKKPIENVKLTDEKKAVLELWDYFIKKVEGKSLGFPIWSQEFGATYPIDIHPVKLNKSELKKYKGCFGADIKFDGEKLIKESLPSYVRDARKPIKKWKASYILKNRELYSKNKYWLDDWKTKVSEFPASLQKLEWNCQNQEREVFNKVIQFRPSGVRIKSKNSIPALVSMNLTQIPYLPWKSRYLTVKEGLALQGLDGLKNILDTRASNHVAIGNAVNSKVVYYISKNLIQ